MIRQWVLVLMYDEWHEDGICRSLGPFDTKEAAEAACPVGEYGYPVPLGWADERDGRTENEERAAR